MTQTGDLHKLATMTETQLLTHLRENPFVLAPMAGITDLPFRSFMREMGCGVVVSELVSATGLKFSSAKTRKLMEFEPTQHPVGIQLFGEQLDHLRDAAQIVEQTGADFVDLNFGCPVPKVVNKGAGSACLKDLNRLRDVVRAAKSGIKIPLTIKIRTGWDANSRNSPEVTQVAYDEGVTWVAIHGRTRAAAYSGLADWDYIRETKKHSRVPVLGNGDIHSPGQAVERLQMSGCDGVLIGRGCLKNPWIFALAQELKTGVPSAPVRPLTEVLARLRQHLEAFYPERMMLLQMRKFSIWFSAGYPGASRFRKTVFQCQDRESTLACIAEFFTTLEGLRAEDTSSEAFLMGGHG
jgi:nifR3 family TIM-barrel protein